MLHAIRKTGVFRNWTGPAEARAAAEPREARVVSVVSGLAEPSGAGGTVSWPPGLVLYYYAGLCWRVPAEPRRPVRLSHLRAEA